jgi:hypothetical protein
MKRLLLIALIFSVGFAPVAYADGSLLASAKRVAQDVGKAQVQLPQTSSTAPALAAGIVQAPGQEGGGGGWSKAKTWVAIGFMGVFAAGALTIQSKGEDTTPSNLGNRNDGCTFLC